MPFQKGNTLSSHRKHPINGLARRSIYDSIEKIVKHNVKNMQVDIEQLSPKERCWFMAAITNYALPKMSSVDITSLGETIAPNNTLSKYSDSDLQQMRDIAKKAEQRQIKLNDK